ncbi:hypothetical protein DYZ85_00748 [Listeria monocytogenes]|uniref:hypothetical protein n=1 Tax=Listeria monocytogenes TaxID=1639 RepID=UPI000E75F5E8|nr:hypothetical protein [Listeria monocytogenes]RKA27966.1 hypothetical protein DYZ85_00748 [Listeria monocytogenes]
MVVKKFRYENVGFFINCDNEYLFTKLEELLFTKQISATINPMEIETSNYTINVRKEEHKKSDFGNLIFKKEKTEIFQKLNHFVIVYGDRSVELIAKHIMRFIRELLVVNMQKRKFYLHAGCIEYYKKGILIIGDKYSGKTTTILNLLFTGKFNYVSNDKVFINGNNISSLPMSMGVRYGTLSKNKTLLKIFNIKEAEYNLYKKNNKLLLSPQRIRDCLNVELKFQSKLSYVLVPKYDPEITMVKYEKSLISIKNIVEKTRIENGKSKFYPELNIERSQLIDLKDESYIPQIIIFYNESLVREFTEVISNWLTEV